MGDVSLVRGGEGGGHRERGEEKWKMGLKERDPDWLENPPPLSTNKTVNNKIKGLRPRTRQIKNSATLNCKA